jgi:hypothetical protein
MANTVHPLAQTEIPRGWLNTDIPAARAARQCQFLPQT